jgi:hypothetical protein
LKTIINQRFFLIKATNEKKKISGYTEYENENEIILRIGTQCPVQGDPQELNDSHIVHVIEIDDNNDEPLASTMNNMQISAK